MIFSLKQIQQLSLVSGIKNEPGSQEDGKDYFKEEVKLSALLPNDVG